MSKDPGPVISLSSLPSNASMTFKDSSFFVRNGPDAKLPTPAEVWARSTAEAPKRFMSFRKPLFYEDLGLVVKLGRDPEVTVAEGQCLWALRRLDFPVPEIYGWEVDGEHTILYMELVKGVTVESRWETMSDAERVGFCGELRKILDRLRSLGQEAGHAFVGHINRTHLRCCSICNGVKPPAGPFPSVKAFHDWLSITIRTGLDQHWPGVKAEDIPDPYRRLVPDASAIVFTHGDLHRSNIMVSDESPCKVVALLDWEQSGWYPEYWEYMKAEYTADWRSEWVQKYVPMLLDRPGEDAMEGFESYARTFGY
ncbi:kinase-like domain-containing protein [Thelonectria olida]|uniref:Kinase-like domain-containing protein n=1 Tax=Thelonectria olida TaxID=1576542 RepID=A0A9P8VZW2_9HYPO|nr:kinase-like domain-containing protein [Thelonectria olida]